MNRILITVFLLIGLAFSSSAFKFDIKPLHLASVVQEDSYATQSSASGIPNQAYNITNYQFIGPSYFNSPKPLNLTFEAFYDKNSGFYNYSTTWKVNKTLSYSIKGIETIYNYSSNGQYARLSPANNEIMVNNGSAKLTVNFYWQKIDNDNRTIGWGTAETTSSEISYIVKLVPNKNNPDFIDENLTEYYPLKFRQMVFTKIDSNITDEDKKNVLALLNDVDTTDSVKDLIEKDINSRYPSILNQHINYGYYKQNYQYVKSTPSQSTVTLNFVDAPCFFNFTKQGIAYGFRLVNSSFPEFEYSTIEPERLDPKIYGQRQQFTSFSHYRNFIWMAIKLNGTMNFLPRTQYQQLTSITTLEN